MSANIPPKFFGHVHHALDETSLRQRLKALKVGEYTVLPLEKRGQIGWAGKSLGYKFVTRQMGEKDTFRCYRVERSDE